MLERENEGDSFQTNREQTVEEHLKHCLFEVLLFPILGFFTR